MRTGDGHTVRTQSVTLHVLGGSGANTPSAPRRRPRLPARTTPPPAPTESRPPPTTGTVNVPTDADGHALPVFDTITPETTTAYVGESVPVRIDSFIRYDSNAQQDSLPTLVGSDFLMNELSLRPEEQDVNVGDLDYIRDSWITAISAPKSGDFPLQVVRDTYWTKAGPAIPNDPFGPLFGRQAQLMHKEISSNKLVMHVLPLPEEGKPAGFTGAIGQFHVSGNAQPTTVGVGEPITLHFVVTGTGNFDYVHAPALAPDPAWKTYVPDAKMTYDDQAKTQGTKTFEEAIIPNKNGTLSLPAATFSYFDPDKKQYVSLPVSLPPVVVTGTAAAPVAVTSAPAAATSTPATPSGVPADVFSPNRLTLGSLTPDLAPGYRHPWFWIVQGVLVLLVIAGVILSLLRPKQDPDPRPARPAPGVARPGGSGDGPGRAPGRCRATSSPPRGGSRNCASPSAGTSRPRRSRCPRSRGAIPRSPRP